MNCRSGELRTHAFAALMGSVHGKHVSDGRHHKTILVGKVETIETVDELSAVCHGDFVGMAVENVEGHSTEDSVAQGRHLLQLVARGSLAARTVPRAPLIHYEFHPVLGILLTDDLPMASDEVLHAIALMQQFVPVDRVEIQRVSFAFIPVLRPTAAEIPGVVMESEAVHGAQQPFPLPHDLFEETAGPSPICRIRAGCDESQLLSVLRHPSREAAELGGVLLGSEIPSTPPGFIAYAPILHIEGISGSGRCSLVCERRASG